MKRFFKVVFLSLIVVQLCLLPVAVEGTCPPCPSATTLPATDISPITATLNGTITAPVFTADSMPTRVLQVSLQKAGIIYYKTFVSFQYGTQPGVYPNQTPQLEVFQGGPVAAQVGGLNPCTTYYYRLVLNVIAPTSDGFYHYGSPVQGAGVGLNHQNLQQFFIPCVDCTDAYGAEVSFQTYCPFIGPGGSGGGGTGATSTGPSNMSNIVVQSATVATAKVSPGESVDIAATVTNKGGANGASKVTLYINGQEADSKGITLSSGQSTTMHFSVSRNDPGSYTVLVNGVPAGSFTVDLFTNNDVLIYGIIALFTIGIIGVLYLVVKRRTA